MKIESINIRVAVITILLFFSVPQYMQAQTNYKILPGKEVIIKVLGGSNVHDWVMTSTGIESQGNFKFDKNNQLSAINSFRFSVDAKSLKSEHESMDSRTYKSIKADQYPKITYSLNSATISQIQKNKYLIKALGDLTIAGNSQAITIDVTATVNPDNTITCTGSEKLKLTDYKIDPPSFMLGAMKVTNDLTIQFNLIYKNNQ